MCIIISYCFIKHNATQTHIYCKQSSGVIMQSNYYAIIIGTAMTAAERQSDLELTTHTPYLALMGELWGISVRCGDFGEIRPCYYFAPL